VLALLLPLPLELLTLPPLLLAPLLLAAVVASLPPSSAAPIVKSPSTPWQPTTPTSDTTNASHRARIQASPLKSPRSIHATRLRRNGASF
jgi:hypothetical protein